MNDTASALRAATRRCIARDGLAATTSRRITAEAGANLGAITYHFDSKDRLVAEALLEGFRELLAPVVDLLQDTDGDPAVRTAAIVRTLLDTLADRRDDAVAYLQALAHTPVAADLQRGITELWAELRDRIAADMASLQDDGAIAAWVEPPAMAVTFVAVANGLLIQAVVDPDGPAVNEAAAQFAGLLLAATSSSS